MTIQEDKLNDQESQYKLEDFTKEMNKLKIFNCCEYIIDLYDTREYIDDNKNVVYEAAMECGETDLFDYLEELRKQKRQLQLATVADLTFDLFSALNALHKAGFIHCDVKLENLVILLNPFRVKLIDFGGCRTIPTGDQGNLYGKHLKTYTEHYLGMYFVIVSSFVYVYPCTNGTYGLVR